MSAKKEPNENRERDDTSSSDDDPKRPKVGDDPTDSDQCSASLRAQDDKPSPASEDLATAFWTLNLS